MYHSHIGSDNSMADRCAYRKAGLQFFTFGVIGVKACLVNGKVRILAVKCEVCVWCISRSCIFCVCGACVEVCAWMARHGLKTALSGT